MQRTVMASGMQNEIVTEFSSIIRQAFVSRAELNEMQKAVETKELYKASPYLLGKKVLGYDRFCNTQMEWDTWIRERIDFKNLQRTLMLIEAPRETLKSSFFTITVPIALLLNNPNLSILIGNEVAANATGFLTEIKHKLQSPNFVGTFGDLMLRDHWRADDITINTRTIHRKEPSIDTVGVGGTKTSRHYDVIILDDIVGQEDSVSRAKRSTTFAFFNGIFDLLLHDTGILIVVGTPWHIHDIYQHIKKLADEYKRKNLGTFHILIKPAHNPEGKINYPELLPETKLEELRTVKQGEDGIDIATYQAQYELNALDPATQIFKEFHYVNPVGLKFSRICQWTDPAMKEDKSSDFSAIIVLGKINGGQYDGRYCVLHASLDKRPLTKLVQDHNRIYREIEKQYPDIEYQVFMEENGFQALRELAVLKSLQDKEEKPVPTRGKANTENKDLRIKSIEPAVSTGIILFREDWQTAPEHYRVLLDQLSDYPQGKKDGPDALHGAYKNCNSRGTQLR